MILIKVDQIIFGSFGMKTRSIQGFRRTCLHRSMANNLYLDMISYQIIKRVSTKASVNFIL